MFTLIWAQLLKDMTQGKISYYKSTAQRLYHEDPVFKEKIRKIIDGCNNFNSLLGKVSAQHKELLSYMEKAHEKR
ncbi:hypothetical protein ACFLZ4_02125 [Patescibacteria group bacterium]